MLSDWRETILCPQVKWLFEQKQTVFDLQLIRHDSEESLPLYEVQGNCLAPTWAVFIEFAFVFDAPGMTWVMASHEDFYPGPAGKVVMAFGGPVERTARLTERHARGLICAGTTRQVHRLASEIVGVER